MSDAPVKEKTEETAGKAMLQVLEKEREYWEQFLRDRTPYNMRPPRVILLSGKTTAYALAENGDVSYTARLACMLSFEEFKAVIVS